jgi:hypothetical protein
MARSIIASLLTVLTVTSFTATSSAMAADGHPPVASDASRSAGVAAASDTDWSLRPIQFGHESRPAALPALYVGYAALQVYDVYSTLTALKSGGAEGNPLLTGIAGNPPALIGVKAGMTGASIFVAERLWRSHHRTQAVAFMVASNGVMAIVAAHNARSARR